MRHALGKNTALIFLLTALVVFSLTRIGLLCEARALTVSSDVPLYQWPGALFKGFLFDLAVIAYLAIPVLLYDAMLPNRWRRSRFHLYLRGTALWFWISILLLVAISELVFWGEFSTRFNFIAVDYLLYTQEVIGNIMESYPVGMLLSLIAIVGLVSAFLMGNKLRVADASGLSKSMRFVYLGLSIALPVLSSTMVDVDQMEGSGNQYIDEISGNGIFTFAAAARSNELDYDRFYKVLPQGEADLILSNLHVDRPPMADRQAVLKHANYQISEAPPVMNTKRPQHVVLITVESLSASYVGAYGSKSGLTPNLDRLAKNAWVFKDVYATGTRTVRGLEALWLGTPPIPGQSIVRRPGNAHLATLGEALDEAGYNSRFIYGGYGYFDNMNAYFSANDYQVADRTDFDNRSVVFENVWGVADESLFDNALRIIDKDVKAGKKAFAHIMTTSNHRPYTYPDGRIDIPSPGGRSGAVKYTDYAIGKFISDAEKYSWFRDTLFVIVADHCASVAGKTKLPVKNYRIPLIMYQPALLKPAVFDGMVSQIDVPPTILDMLGIRSEEHFFGTSIFRQKAGEARAFISNYQELGYLRNDVLTVLSPKKKVEAFSVNPKTQEMKPRPVDLALEKEAIAYYQTAAHAFKQGELRSVRYPATMQ